MEALEKLAQEIDNKVEQLAKASKDEAAQIAKDFHALKDEYNAKFAEYMKNLETVQKSVDAIAIEKKRFEENQIKSFRSELESQLKSENFRSFIKAKKSGERTAKHSITIDGVDTLKATVTPSTATADTSSPQYLPTGIIYDPDRMIHVRDFIPGGATTVNTLVVPVETSITDGTAVTAEGVQKGVSAFALDNKTFPVMKIASVLKISEEMLDDVDGLVTYIVNRFTQKLRSKEDYTLLYSVASSTAFDGLTVAAQAYVDALADSAVTEWDVLMAAITQAKVDEYIPNYVMIHPTTGLKLKTAKGSDEHYLGRAPWDKVPMTVDGVPIIETTAIGVGEFIVGDFAKGAQVFDRKSVSVNFYDQDEDNAQKNLITVVTEERLALVIYRANAFVYGDFESALALGSA